MPVFRQRRITKFFYDNTTLPTFLGNEKLIGGFSIIFRPEELL
jgi:hypothetical protein